MQLFRHSIAAVALLLGAFIMGAVAPAAATPRSYAKEHSAWCAQNRHQNVSTLGLCADRDWCTVHANDSRISRLACDPMLSRADSDLPKIVISTASLANGRDLTWLESQSFCFDKDSPNEWHGGCGQRLSGEAGKHDGPDPDLLPQGMKTARLALCAHISVWTFPATVVKIGIVAADRGVLSLSWNLNGNGPRQTRSIHLNRGEIDHLLAALNKSSFWRLPRELSHMGAADGEVATVEISVPDHKHHVTDFIGNEDAVDLSILVNAVSTLISHHWQQVPGG